MHTRTSRWRLLGWGMAVCAGGTVSAQTTPGTPGDQALRDAFGVDDLTVETLDVPQELPADFTVDVTIEGVVETLHLQRTSMRTDDFRVRVHDRSGLRVVDAPPVRTYRGEIVGRDGTRVSATLAGSGSMTATIALEDGGLWHVQPLGDVVFATDADLHVAYARDAVRPDDRPCGTDVGPGGDGEPLDPPGGGGAASGGGEPIVAVLAFDADHEFYELNGSSVADTVADIEAVMNGVTAIYESQLNIGYVISEIVVRTSEPDPYETTQYFDLLIDFGTHWNNQHDDVVRDAAHLMTGKDLDGSVIGIAWASVMCTSPGSAYGISQSRYTANFAKRVSLTAHELGHNWSAGHCASSCASGGDPDCAIMCPCNGGCSGDVTSFGAAASAEITQFANSVSCLGEDLGACCMDDGSCTGGLTSQACSQAGGVFQGEGSLCADSACGGSCPCDIDGDGNVGVTDMIAVVSAWGGSGGAADVNDDGVVDVQDLQAILIDWGPCSE